MNQNLHDLLTDCRRIIDDYRRYGDEMAKHGRGATFDVEPGADGTRILQQIDFALRREPADGHGKTAEGDAER